MLKFIGCGNAFNTKLGNNCAYIKKENVLFLIDCGSSTFSRIQQNNLLTDVDEICVLLTHTHNDHVGSLGDLIFYGYYSVGKPKKPNVHIFAPSAINIRALLKKMGVQENVYTLTEFKQSSEIQLNHFHLSFECIPVKHVKHLNCFGYIIHYESKTIYYSGDCYEIPNSILKKLHNGEFDQFYQDTCQADFEDNVHLSLRKLDECIEKEVRHLVFCMHLDEGFHREEANALGFNVVEPMN